MSSVAISYLCLAVAAVAQAQSGTDFSGEWKLNPARSEIGKLPAPPEMSLQIDQSAASLTVWSSSPVLYPLDGRTETRKANGLSFSTQTKWEGQALLSNTIVNGDGKNYTIMERWKRSANGATLTIRRTIVDKGGEAESILVYEKPIERTVLDPARQQTTAPAKARSEADFVVTSGTRILLHLKNAVDTKHSAPGDRVYLETSMPVFVNQQMVIPQGSYVLGTVTEALRAGKVKGKSAMNIRFDSITLPNGITRDFRSRVGSAEAATVDKEEGRIKGESGKGNDAKTVGATTAGGAAIGTIAGAGRNAPLSGLGIGAAAGGAAGLIGVLMSRGPDVILRPGTSVEMVLDRDLHFTADELTRWDRSPEGLRVIR
jgi:type IV secretion system protein VirB10